MRLLRSALGERDDIVHIHELKLDQGDAPVSPEVEEQMARLKPEEGGEMIGPYNLREQIGEGGFGTVRVADQGMPVRRRVALKHHAHQKGSSTATSSPRTSSSRSTTARRCKTI